MLLRYVWAQFLNLLRWTKSMFFWVVTEIALPERCSTLTSDLPLNSATHFLIVMYKGHWSHKIYVMSVKILCPITSSKISSITIQLWISKCSNNNQLNTNNSSYSFWRRHQAIKNKLGITKRTNYWRTNLYFSLSLKDKFWDIIWLKE